MVSPELLRRYKFFAGLSMDQIVTVARAANEAAAEAEHIFFHEGEQLSQFYVILEGTVAITIELPRHDKETVLSTLGPGGLFGWSGLVPPHETTAGAKSLTLCRVVSFECEEIRRSFETDWHLGYIVMQGAAQIVRQRLRALRMETLGYVAE